jgi:hypothetical protein
LEEETSSSRGQGGGNTYQQFRLVDERISAGVMEMIEEIPEKVEAGM